MKQFVKFAVAASVVALTAACGESTVEMASSDEATGDRVEVSGELAGDCLQPGQVLWRHQSVRCGQGILAFQGDGNLAMYDGANRARWWTGTNGPTAWYAIFQTDGNLVVYNTANRPMWHSNTYGNPGARLVPEGGFALSVVRGDNMRLWSTGAGCVLYANESIPRGGALGSCVGGAILYHQGDGNLVLRRGGNVLWQSRTNGAPTTNLVMQSDGNLVLYDVFNRAVFHTRTHGHPGSFFVMHNNCNGAVHGPAGRVLFTTGTGCW